MSFFNTRSYIFKKQISLRFIKVQFPQTGYKKMLDVTDADFETRREMFSGEYNQCKSQIW